MGKNNLRLSKDTTAHYSSFEEALKSLYGKSVKRKTSDAKKLKTQQERFLGKCWICGQPLSYVNSTNVLVCANKNCKGIEKTTFDDEGNEKKFYIPVSRMVDEVGMEIAMNIFS